MCLKDIEQKSTLEKASLFMSKVRKLIIYINKYYIYIYINIWITLFLQLNSAMKTYF